MLPKSIFKRHCINKFRHSLRRIQTNATETDSRELRIPLPYGGHIAGKIWNERGQIPILGLHGWLDNAGTFDTLAPLLPKKYSLVAIDFPGHGLSSRMPVGLSGGMPGATFHLLEVIHRVINHYNWDKITIMGHSMGGGAAFIYACTLRDKVDKLILLDALKPIQMKSSEQPDRTATYLKTMFELDKKRESEPPAYELDEIVERIVTSYHRSVNDETAKILLKRGAIRRGDNKFCFSYDPLHKTPNPISLGHDQQKEFASRINCEVLILKASLGPLFEDRCHYQDVLDIIKTRAKRLIYHVIEGTHHLHLNNPTAVIPFITDFLKDH